ncbi:hypothetical protein LRAMOSA03269 [Lichtheimia ramosa]|uniref:Arrestin-like N-terminal domain-containing protein n=1 Tax=Lichtheimia ramosa TaxID=688394 RepID=A0A077WUM9_9FUNG|nr:hypothetical protein LRAMOSA03269 [Lichtheimia ramosa]
MPVIVPFLSGSSKQLSIDIEQPIVYLRGPPSHATNNELTGSIVLNLSKPLSASLVDVKFVGKAQSQWPEGIGPRGTKLYHEKVIWEQQAILWQPDVDDKGMIPAGEHRWPFQFTLSNSMVETIEDDMAQVSYYLSATVRRPGSLVNWKRRRDMLVLRTLSSDDRMIRMERETDWCTATIALEQSAVVAGAHFPLTFMFVPKQKGVALECISMVVQEHKAYRLAEYHAARSENMKFKINLDSASSATDPEMEDASFAQLRRALNAKNAHIPLTVEPFQYRLVLQMPDCKSLTHSTYFPEIEIRHILHIHMEFSMPNCSERSVIDFRTPITIMDCRLKDEFGLPAYEECAPSASDLDRGEGRLKALSNSLAMGFFVCPCYTEYRKTVMGNREDFLLLRQQIISEHTALPPPYDG